MNIVLVYASNSGSTYICSKIIQECLESVRIIKAVDALPEDVLSADLVILGSPSWDIGGKEGQPHEYISNLLSKLTSQHIKDKKFALYGCGDRSYLRFCGAVDEMEKDVSSKGAILVTDSLKLDSFFFDMDKNTKLVKDWAAKLAKVPTLV